MMLIEQIPAPKEIATQMFLYCSITLILQKVVAITTSDECTVEYGNRE